MTDTEIQKGDSAAYSWGGDKKGGTVTEVATDSKVEMETVRGNTVAKEGTEDNPAVRLKREGHDVVKKASELTKEKPGESHNEGGVQKTVAEKESKPEPKTGEKRSADDVASKENGTKETGTKENGDEPPKKKGRPAKDASSGPKKEPAKKRAPKKAATESGEPRRSGRVASKSS